MNPENILTIGKLIEILEVLPKDMMVLHFDSICGPVPFTDDHEIITHGKYTSSFEVDFENPNAIMLGSYEN